MIERGGGVDSSLWWYENVTGDVHVAFTSVRAGNLARHVGEQADVDGARERLEHRLGLVQQRFRYLHQTHSATVLDAESERGEAPEGDAWVSARGRQPLAVLVADCLPVVLVGHRGAHAEPSGAEADPITAVAHAGRPGLTAGILERTVQSMRERGACRLRAWIGPGACGSCYEVPQEMAQRLGAERPALLSETSWGTPALNLRAEAQNIFDREGIQVAAVAGCTIEDETLFSHRRAPDQGRIAALVWRAT